MSNDNANHTAHAFNEAIIKQIGHYYPGAIKGNIEHNAAAAAALSVALGGLLAFAFRLNGEVVGRSVLQAVVSDICKNATAIDAKAGELIRANLPKVLLN